MKRKRNRQYWRTAAWGTHVVRTPPRFGSGSFAECLDLCHTQLVMKRQQFHLAHKTNHQVSGCWGNRKSPVDKRSFEVHTVHHACALRSHHALPPPCILSSIGPKAQVPSDVNAAVACQKKVRPKSIFKPQMLVRAPVVFSPAYGILVLT